jgi:hypothetical protein
MSQRRSWFVLVCLAVVAVALGGFALRRRHLSHTPTVAAPIAANHARIAPGGSGKLASDPRLQQSLEQLPLSFERRDWESAGGTRYVSSGPGYALSITRKGATLTRRFHLGADASSVLNPEAGLSGRDTTVESNVQFSWLGANPSTTPTGEEHQHGYSNYFPTADRRTWRKHVGHYGSVRLGNLYKGVDLRFHGDHKELEFDYIVKAGADPSAIRLGISVPSIVSVTPNGQLQVMQNGDAIRLERPVAYQMIHGKRHEVDVMYALDASESHEAHFNLGAFDHSSELIIDPILAFSSHFGATSNLNLLSDVALDAAGNIYVAGSSCDVDYPVTPGAYQPTGGSITAELCNTGVLTELDPTASSLIFSTYFGSQNNVTSGIKLLPMADGELVVGTTTALDFPTTANAYQKTAGGGTCDYGPFLHGKPCSAGFATKFSPDGSSMVFSTYLGGTMATLISSVAKDTSGNLFLVGATNSPTFPMTSGSVGPSYGGGTCQSGEYPCFDGLIAKMTGDGSSLLAAAYLGGNDDDFVSDVTLDTTGNVYVSGTAYSTNYPTTANAFQKTHTATADQGDAFVAKITPDLKTFVYSTYLGGGTYDIGLGITVDSTGSAYSWGTTASSDFPVTSGAFQGNYAGPAGTTFCDTAIDSSLLLQPSCGDVFVAKLNPNGSALTYSTYIGGSAADIAFRGALDPSNNLWLLAQTASTDFPFTSDAYYSSTSQDIVLMQLSADGSKLNYATPLAEGNTGQSLALGLKLDATGNVYAAGQATTFLTTPGQFTSGTGPAVFVAKYSLGTDHPSVSLSSNEIDFPTGPPTLLGSSSAPQSVTLTNTGTAPLNLSIGLPASYFGAPPAPFSEYDNCGATVAAGASCTINAVFQPTATSGSGGQIVIVDNAPNAPHVIPLGAGNTGTVDAASFIPSTLSFPNQGPGTSSAAQLSGLATPGSGTNALEPSQTGPAVIGGPNAADFQVDTSSCNSLPFSCEVSVVFAPSASATGTRTATVTVPTNAPNSPQVLTLTGTVATGPSAVIGSIFIIPTPVGQGQNSSFSIGNSGGQTLNVTNVTLSGPNASEFTLSGENCSFPAFTVANGTSCGIGILFNPTAHGPRTATLTLADNEAKPSSVTFTAMAVNSTDAAFQTVTTPSPIGGVVQFPDSVVGTTGISQALVSLLNEGPGAGSITSVTMMGDYTQTNDCPKSIPNEGSCTFTVLFSPKSSGVRNGSMTIVTSAPGPQTFVFNYTGNGVLTPVVSLTPPQVSFGEQGLNTPSTAQKVTLANTGNGPFNISGLTISAPFTQTNTCGATLAAGASCTFNIVFTPTVAGNASGLLSFKGNAMGGLFSVAMNGSGATGATPQLTPSSLTFPATAIGSVSAAQTVVLSNPGNAPFTFGGLQASTNYKASTTCSGAIAPGASCNISVQLAPTNQVFTGGFPVNGAVYVATGTKGSPLTIETTGTASDSTGAPTNLGIVSSVNPSTVGQAVTFTGTVTPVSAGATPTGTITFFDGAATIGTPQTLVNGTAAVMTSTLSQGFHSITITYSGDSNYAPENSSGLPQTVNAGSKATTTTSVTSTPNPATSGQSVKFTASVTSTTSGTITGTVQFYDGATVLGSPVTLAGGSAVYSTTTLSQGSHSITATYSGDSTYGTSTSTALTQTINAGSKASTATAVSSSLNPSTVGASVTFTAAVTSSTAGTITGTVQFYDGATALGSPVTLAAGAAQYSTSALSAGAHTITATYSGDSTYATSTSPGITQTVNGGSKSSTTTAVSSSLNPSTVGANVTFTAMVMSSQAGTITGTVQFYDGGAALGSPVTLASGSAMYASSTLAQGSHMITATYSGDGTYATSTSPAVTQTVNAATNGDFGVSVTPSSLTVTAGQSGNFSVAVAPVSGSTQTVSLSCSGLPANASCSFASNSVTLDGKDTVSVASAIVTSTGGAAVPLVEPASSNPTLPPATSRCQFMVAIVAAIASLMLIRTSRNRAWRLALAMVLLMLPALAITACSGSGSSSRTPKGTYTVTVTGTSGATTHNAQLSVTVD